MNTKPDTVAVILAAGMSKRMRSELPKPMHKVGGTPMIGMVYEAVRRAGIERCVVVVGQGAEAVREYLGDKVEYAVQREQLGTGHAALTALDYLASGPASTPTSTRNGGSGSGGVGSGVGRALVLFGDMPFISSGSISRIVDGSRANGEIAALMYADMPDPSGLGRIVRDDAGRFVRIVQERDASEEIARITEADVGVFCFDAAAGRRVIAGLERHNAQGEIYLTDLFESLAAEGGNVGLYALTNIREGMGANDRAALAELNRAVRLAKCEALMLESGVTILDPATTYIDSGVEVGMDTVIYPGCVLEGGTVIGKGAEIGPYTRITDSVIGDGARVMNSVLTGAKVGNGTTVGPFAYLRPGADVGVRVKIGDFVEIKNSTVGAGTSVAHLAYIGDADVGANVNIGCGTITCNYDGKRKHRTTIGDNAFIGSNTNLIAPVTVNGGAYVASGSTVTEEVPEDALAIARARQVNKENWVSKRGFTRGNGRGAP